MADGIECGNEDCQEPLSREYAGENSNRPCPKCGDTSGRRLALSAHAAGWSWAAGNPTHKHGHTTLQSAEGRQITYLAKSSPSWYPPIGMVCEFQACVESRAPTTARWFCSGDLMHGESGSILRAALIRSPETHASTSPKSVRPKTMLALPRRKPRSYFRRIRASALGKRPTVISPSRSSRRSTELSSRMRVVT